MKNLFLLIICFGLISCTQNKDDEIVVKLDRYYDEPTRGYTVLYPISQLEDSIRSKIKYPDLTSSTDTAFSKFYYTGENDTALKDNILMLLANQKSRNPTIWVDSNNNLDLTDDGQPLLFSEENLDITITNSSNEDLSYTFRLIKPDSALKENIKTNIEKYITKGSPYRGFYMNQRRNVKMGKFIFDQDSLSIGVKDWNVNGKFDDLGEDRILVGEYGGKLNGTDQASGAIIIDSTNYFQGNTNAFQITSIAEDGKSLTLEPTLNTNVENRISEGQTIPDFSFELLNGKEVSISEFLTRDKLLYVNIWANWCSGCHQEIEDLKEINSNYADRITILSLNYNEKSTTIKSFLNRYDVDWVNGYSTSEINQRLFVEGVPRNILIDGTGKILKMNVYPAQVLRDLKSE